jgi:hypothetical protein
MGSIPNLSFSFKPQHGMNISWNGVGQMPCGALKGCKGITALIYSVQMYAVRAEVKLDAGECKVLIV